MNLRQKLVTTFGGLGLMILLVGGATFMSAMIWQKTNAELEEHYQRSLLLQQIEAIVYRAAKEIPDALTALDDDAKEEFTALIATAADDFNRWVALAHTEEELAQVKGVRSAYEMVIADAQQVFELIEQNRFEDAARIMEEQLDDKSLRQFRSQTRAAAASDRLFRQHVQDRVNWIRRADNIILAIAAFGTISLMLLLFAYMTGDLFSPLNQLAASLEAVAAGDYQRRIPVERKDELGNVQRAFNRMVESVAERQQLSYQGISGDSGDRQGRPWQDLPSRVTLHRLLSRLKVQVRQLSQRMGETNSDTAIETVESVTASLDHLLETVVRFAEFGFPLDLNLSRFDVRTLLYEVLLRFHEPFAQRGVGFEIDLAPGVERVVADRLKLREILGEIIHNALAALPERGGHIGVHASLGEDGSALQIEVADDGKGAEPQLINRAFSIEDTGQSRPAMGLAFTRSIVEQHGGRMLIHSQPDEGTYVRLTLPHRIEEKGDIEKAF